MLIWICALHCEAKPVIDFYRLKKSPEKTNFDCYENNEITCIVSGMGSNNMTRSINWANTQLKSNREHCWINLGTAGNKNLPIGTPVLISEASQSNNLNSFFTTTKISHSFESRPIISLTQEQTDYDEVALFDMEAFEFFHSLSKVSSAELCQSIKVISDNRETPPTRNKALISKLIADNMKQISEFAKHLQILANGHQSELSDVK